MPVPPGNALVVGGTGMLAGATRWLADRAGHMLLVSRNASRFEADGAITSLDIDWSDPSFRQRTSEAIARTQPIGIGLLWLHHPQPVLDWLLPLVPAARTVIVLGSMDGRPVLPKGAGDASFVRLGSKAAAQGRRWLTHEEICDAAIGALEDGRSRIVGELRSA
ncbi:MAG: hypothetical protein QM688_03220 [Sphingomonas bacterium]